MPINQLDRRRDHQVLDPCLLGRPVHLLPAFAAGLAEAIGAEMASPGGRRHWGTYRLEHLAFERAPEQARIEHLMVAPAVELINWHLSLSKVNVTLI